MEEKFYSFNEALRELQMEEHELNKLVEEGELRAYSQGGQIRFSKTDINALTAGRMVEPTITVPCDEIQFEEYIFFDSDQTLESPNEAIIQTLVNVSLEDLLANTENPILKLYSDLKENQCFKILMENTEKKSNSSRDTKKVSEQPPKYQSFVEIGEEKEEDELSFDDDISMNDDDLHFDSEKKNIPPEPVQPEKSFKKKLLKTMTILALLAFAYFLSQSLMNRKALAIVRPIPCTVIQDYTFQTRLHPAESTEIKALQKGKIASLFPSGQSIKHGDILAKIMLDNQNIKLEIERLEKKIASWQTLYFKTDQDIDSEEKILKEYLSKYKELNDYIVSQDSIHLQGVDKKILEKFKLIKNHCETLRLEKEDTKKSIEKLNNEIAQKKEKLNMDSISIYSPHAGIIEKWDVTENENVSENQILCFLGKTGKLTGEFIVPKKEMLKCSKEDKVIIVSQEEYPGHIQDILAQNDALKVQFTIDNPENRLPVNAEIPLLYKAECLAYKVPKAALIKEHEKTFVAVWNNNEISRCEVKLLNQQNKDDIFIQSNDIHPEKFIILYGLW